MFPAEIIKANASTWQAIRVSEGSAGGHESSLVHPMSSQLAKHNISIYYLVRLRLLLLLRLLAEHVQHRLDARGCERADQGDRLFEEQP